MNGSAKRYAEMFPPDLERALSELPVAVWPFGALEWHGTHLPFGMDGLVSERFAEELSLATGAVLLPGCWLPITTLPHRFSLSVRTETMRAIVADTLNGLHGAGFRVVCIVTGHYAQGHEIELYRAALAAMSRHSGFSVLAASPLELLGDDSLLDHAGRSETAQMLAVRPDLVRLETLPAELEPRRDAVLGSDPRRADAEEGVECLARARTAWADRISELIREPDGAWLRQFYTAREGAYADYVERFYKGSWEDAIKAWWETKV